MLRASCNLPRLIDLLVDTTIDYLNMQVEAAETLALFDMGSRNECLRLCCICFSKC